MNNPDILFFQALVAAGLSPYQAEQVTRQTACPRPQPDHSLRLLYCRWAGWPPGWGGRIIQAHDKLYAARQ